MKKKLDLKSLEVELRQIREREEVEKLSEKRGNKEKKVMIKKERERGGKEGGKWKIIKERGKIREKK